VSGTTVLECYDADGNLTASYGYNAGADRVLRNGSAASQEDCIGVTFTPNADTTSVKIELEFEDEVENRVKVDTKATARNLNRSSITP
jgi:hypothetical protein